MSEGSAEDAIREPNEWDCYENSNWKWENIQMKEVVYSDLPSGAEEAIADFIRVDDCLGYHIERVHRLNPQTIEIVWYDDEGESNHDKSYYENSVSHTLEDWREDKSPTKVSDRYIKNVRIVIQSMFGDQWRVTRKEDGRQWNDESPQRAIVRRADHQRFTYSDESEGEYLLNLHGKPDNAPEWAQKYQDLPAYPIPPKSVQHRAEDVYCYETSTGTIHLIGENVRNKWVAEDLSCECGLTVQASVAVDTDRIEHYAGFLQRQRDRIDLPDGFESVSLDPQTRIGEDLCDRCWRSYAKPEKNHAGKVTGYRAPAVDDSYADLLDWTEAQP